ncbi:MAG TPA: permease-like cell division protein FtsX [Vicinamibacterales bacterium]|nr:permease-like cell division protein FtsX [Vicinamibacterales bacterium]
MRALRYAFAEAAASLARRKGAATAAMLAIAAALAVPAAVLVVLGNAERLVARWQASAELSVFLRDEATADERAAIERLLDGSGLVARRAYVSKAEALRRFQADFPELAAAAVADNPLPASIEVGLRADADSAAVERLAARAAALSAVADVRFDRAWLDRLALALQALRGLGLAIGLILGAAAALTVGNVVRQAVDARRHEIEIMQLVGAPAAYVRGPFVAEGLLQGGAGAIGALLLLWIGVVVARASYGGALAAAVGLDGITFLSPGRALAVVLTGTALGSLGGYLAARGVRTW